MLNVFCELSRAIGRSMPDVPSLLSTNFCTKGEKHAFARALDNVDFRSLTAANSRKSCATASASTTPACCRNTGC